MKQFIKCEYCGEVQLYDDEKVMARQHKCFKCETWLLEGQCVPIKALSIKQPWASLILNGHKNIENRNTLKNFRSTFLIHAGLQFDYSWFSEDNDNWFALLNINDEYGGIIGYAEIIDCVTSSNSPWFVGKYGFIIKNPRSLPFTACKGKLSFFYPKID